MEYREDIDGLRAIAVLAVLACHINFPFFSGGFTGVDLFFAISGYLIVGQLYERSQSVDGLNWLEFYARRVRRLLPASLLVLTATCFIGSSLLWPGGDWQGFAKSAIAAALGVSNLYFWAVKPTDYFDAGEAVMPLLHTWSLGVEEQFYLGMPVLFGVVALAAKRLRCSTSSVLIFILCLGAAVSIGVALWTSLSHVRAGFYTVPPRAYEFLSGALVAVIAKPGFTKAQGELLTWSGMGLLAISFTVLNDSMAIPGLWSVVPVAAGALLLWGGASSERLSTSSILSSRPLRWVGLRSYSIYLWHWPLLVFWREYTQYSASIWSEVILCVIAIALAEVTYRWVEKPARRGQWSRSLRPSQVLAYGLLATLFVVGLAGASGMRARVVRQVEPLVAGPNQQLEKIRACFEPDNFQNLCGATESSSRTAIIWGDSHASHLVPAVPYLASLTRSTVEIMASGGCPPVFGYMHPMPSAREKCPALNRRVKQRIKTALSSGPTTVVLAARWELYLYQDPISKGEPVMEFSVTNGGDSGHAFVEKLQQTVNELLSLGVAVVLVGPVPEQRVNIPKCLYFKRLNPKLSCGVAREIIQGYQEPALSRLRHIARNVENVSLLELVDLFCNSLTCFGGDSGDALYVDDDHLSSSGVALLEGRLADAINRSLSTLDLGPGNITGKAAVGAPAATIR